MSEPRINELLAIALEVLEQDGLENLGVGTISRRAGIKPPSLYKQFESKDDIEQQLADLGFRLWQKELLAAVTAQPETSTRRDRIATIAHSYRSLGLDHPQLFRLMNVRAFLGTQLVAGLLASTRVGFDELFPDMDVGLTFWAWGHGLLVLEIASRFPAEFDLDVAWEKMIDTVAGLVEA
jgi:AcrR family transcriptional regulator